LTTQHRPSTEPLRVPIAARGRLQRPCFAMADQVRALDRSRFREGPLATLAPEELAALERALKAVLGML
jgi:mRNA interferase MazF